MLDHRLGHQPVGPSEFGTTLRQVDILVIEEVPLVEATGCDQERRGEEHRPTGEQCEVANGRLGRGILTGAQVDAGAVATDPDAEAGDLGPAGREQHRLGCTYAFGCELVNQRRYPIGPHGDIVVQERHQIGTGSTSGLESHVRCRTVAAILDADQGGIRIVR